MAIDVIITPGTGEIKWVDSGGSPQNVRIRGESQNELYFTSDNYATQQSYYAYSDINATLDMGSTGLAPMMVLQDSTTGAILAPGYDHGFSLGATTHRWRGYFSAVSMLGDLVASQLAAPTNPSVAVQGTGTNGAYSYKITALSTLGETTAASVTTSVGPAALSGANYNRVLWDPVNGAITYKVYGRTSGNEVLLATVNANDTAQQSTTQYFYDDKGASVVDSSTAPATNTTGSISLATALKVPSGGTGVTTFTANGVLYGNGTSAIQATAVSGSIGAVLATATAGGAPAFTTTLVGTYVISPAAASSGAPAPVLTVTAPSHTSVTASTEYTGVNFNLATTVTFLAGTIASQRFVRFQQPTIAFTAAGTATTTATVTIEGAPRAGANATLTESAALHVLTGTAAGMGLLITGASNQSGDYLEVLSPAGTALIRYTAANRLTLGPDVELYRSSANKLSLGSNDQLDVGGGLGVAGYAANNAYGIRSGDGVQIQQLTTTGTASANQSLLLTGTAHFNITNSEYNDVDINLSRTVTLSSGNRSLMRAFRIAAPTYAFTTVATITNAATVQIDSAPVPGTNATLTETAALRVLTGTTTGKGVVVRAAASQSALLIDAQNSSGTSLFTVSATGTATVGSDLVVQGAKELRLNNSTDGNYTGFKAPSGLSSNIIYTLPSSQTTDYFLKTDGAGNLSWAAATATGVLAGSGTATYVAYYTDSTTLSGSANFIFTGVQLQLSNATSSGGILLGGDAQLYRGAADVLRTPDSLRIDTRLGVGADPHATYSITTTGDINVASGAGFLINGAATAGYYLRGDGTRFVGTSQIDSEEIDIFKYGTLTNITDAGWYRIASNAATSGRGSALITVGPSGGGDGPIATQFIIDKGFQPTLADLSVAVLQRNTTYALGVDKIRVCRDGDNHIYAEVYVSPAVSAADYYARIVHLSQDFIGSWAAVNFTAGSAEVETVTLDLDSDGTAQGIYHSSTTKTVFAPGRIGIGASTNASYSINAASDINVASTKGYLINGGATSGNVLRGDGTRFVSAQLAFSDLSGTATVSQGGTGTGSLTQYGVAYGDGTTYLKVTAAGTNGQFLVGTTSNAPKFVTMAGDVVITNTGLATIQANAVTTGKINDSNVTFAKIQNIAGSSIFGNTSTTAGTGGTITATADGQVLRRASGVLGFGAISLSDGTNAVSGTLGVANGGTGTGSLTQYGLLYGDGTNYVKVTGTGINGQFLIGTTSNAPAFVTMSGDVTILNTGLATITASAVTTGKISDSNVTFAKIQNIAGSSIFGNTATTAGTGGTITATADGQVLRRASGTLGFGAISLSDGTNAVSGTLGVANGGTGSNTTFTQGSIVFAGASGVYSQNNGSLFWDNTNLRMGVNTATPSAFMHVASRSAGTTGVLIVGTTSQTSDLFELQSASGTSLAVFTSNGSLWLKPYGTAAGNTNELRFYELAANGSNFSLFKTPDNMGTSFVYTWPNATPTANQVLTATSVTNTSIVLGWSTPTAASGSGTVSYGGAGEFAYYSSAGTAVTGATTFKFVSSYLTYTPTEPEVSSGEVMLLLQSSGAAAVAPSVDRTYLRINAASSFAGSLIDLRVNGASKFAISEAGKLTTLIVAGTSKLEDHVSINGGASKKSLRLHSDATYYTALQSGTLSAANLTFTLPTGYGSSGQFLQTDGSGGLTWGTASGTSSSSGYATIQEDAAALTQRATLNFAAGIKAADNAGSTRTDVRVQRVVFLQMAAGLNPTVGPDNAVFRIPESPSDGATVMTFNLRKFFVRVETPSAGTTKVQIEKSAGGGVFSASPTQMLTASSGSGVSAVTSSNELTITGTTSYEFYSGSFTGTLTTGDLIRLDFTAVGTTHANFSISLLMEET